MDARDHCAHARVTPEARASIELTTDHKEEERKEDKKEKERNRKRRSGVFT